MDQVFLELIGKPQLNPAKIITVVAENFTFIEDHAKFLKATLAIPAVKQLPLESVTKYLLNCGQLHSDIKSQLNKDEWTINEYYQTIDKDICDQMQTDVGTSSRSIIFINDASRLTLLTEDPELEKKFLVLIDSWKRLHNNFVVILYQNSIPRPLGPSFLKNLEYLSDAVIRTTAYKTCYFQSIWFQTLPSPRTLIPPRVVASYVTSKIGKSYWSPELLCFFDRKDVPKDYDPDSDTQLIVSEEKDNNLVDEEDLRKSRGEMDPETPAFDMSSTLPYTRAQNPEQSRIFYYPDKEDDVDEDDPDNDLGI